jgi:hypothetical protein
MKHTPRLRALALGLTLVSSSLDAAAQSRPAAPPDRRALLAQAQRARTQGNHSLALYFAEQAGRLQMTSSVRRFIAEEQLALGQLAEAVTSAEQCVREANAEPPSENHGIVLTGCQDMVRTLVTRVASASVTTVLALPTGIELSLSGRPLARESLVPNEAACVWVMPGRQTLRAQVAGFAPSEVSRELAAGQVWVVRIDAPPAPARRACAAQATRSQTDAPPAQVDTLAIPGAPAALDRQPRVWIEQLGANDAASSPITVTVDGREAPLRPCGAASDAASIELSAGQHQIAFSRALATTIERTITVREGEDLSIGRVTLEAIAPPPRMPAVQRRTVVTRGWSAIGPVIAGVGVASLGAAAAVWIASNGAYDSLRARCAASGCPGDQQASDEAAHIRTLDASTTGLLIGGAIAAATGAVLTFAVRPEQRTTVSVVATHQGVSVLGTF